MSRIPEAATLTGDLINQLDPIAPHTNIPVGFGVDFTEGFITFDYNAGTFGNEFVIDVRSPVEQLVVEPALLLCQV